MVSVRGRLVLTGALLAGALVCGSLGLSGPAGAQESPADLKKTTTTLPEREVSKRIDAEIAKIYERDGIKPSGPSSDEEFIRRVYLDTVGMPPKPEEVVAFLSDKDKDKRRKLIDRLVDDERFGRHIADMWGNVIIGRTGRDYGGSNHLFALWLSERINNGDPFSDIIYDIVTAEGALADNPAVAFYAREVPFRIANTAGNISRNLTGVQIQCAECHDHHYEEAWTQDVFAGVASFFSPVQVRVNNRSLPLNPSVQDQARMPRIPGGSMERLPEQARARVAEIQKYLKPATLDGTEIRTRNRAFWRPALAKWMVSDENTQTASYVANRFWSFTFGIGLLNPVDDFNSFNLASHPELLSFLGADLIHHNYDIKRLYRAILNSRTYQLSSKTPPKNAEAWHFASAPVRQLTPEQFFSVLIEVAGGKDLARVLRMRNGSIADQVKRRYEIARRRMQRAEENEMENMRQVSFDEETMTKFVQWYEKMPDIWYLRRSMAQQFASLSSDDEMNEANAFSLTIDQALLVMNGDITSRLSGSTRGTPIHTLLRTYKKTEDRIEQLFLLVLARKPARHELSGMKKFIGESKDEASAYEDIMFALLAGTEFATNH